MTTLEDIIEELKTLPPNSLEKAVIYVHALSEEARAKRLAGLKATAGCLEGELGESFANAIEEGCERIDERDW